MKNKVAFVIKKKAGLPCSCPSPSPCKTLGCGMHPATHRMPATNAAPPCCRGSGNSCLGVGLLWVPSCANVTALKHPGRVLKPWWLRLWGKLGRCRGLTVLNTLSGWALLRRQHSRKDPKKLWEQESMWVSEGKMPGRRASQANSQRPEES